WHRQHRPAAAPEDRAEARAEAPGHLRARRVAELDDDQIGPATMAADGLGNGPRLQDHLAGQAGGLDTLPESRRQRFSLPARRRALLPQDVQTVQPGLLAPADDQRLRQRALAGAAIA